MEVEIVSKYENKLLGRTEVKFRAMHPQAKTPQRDEVREALAQKLGGKKDAVVVAEMHSDFGKPETTGYAKVYASVEAARKLEAEHIQKRNKIAVQPKGEKKEA